MKKIKIGEKRTIYDGLTKGRIVMVGSRTTREAVKNASVGLVTRVKMGGVVNLVAFGDTESDEAETPEGDHDCARGYWDVPNVESAEFSGREGWHGLVWWWPWQGRDEASG
jgi:hypothetical protein